MPQIGLDTCSFRDKTVAKTEKIVQEVEKPQSNRDQKPLKKAQPTPKPRKSIQNLKIFHKSRLRKGI